MKFTIKTPKTLATVNEKLIFNIMDYYTLVNRLKDSDVIFHDHETLKELKNYLYNLGSIQNELLNLGVDSKHMSILKTQLESVQNHIVFLVSYIKAIECNEGYINENKEETKSGYYPIKSFIENIDLLIDNAFEWLDFSQYSKAKAEELVYKKYREFLSEAAFEYYYLIGNIGKAKEVLNSTIFKVGSNKCKKILHNYEKSLKSLNFCKNLSEEIDKKH